MILNILLAFLSGVLLFLIFPGFSFVWLAPVALVPLFLACARETRWRIRFALGYGAGVVRWFGLCNWMGWTLAHHGGMSNAVAWLVVVLFVLAKSFQMGLFAALARRLPGPFAPLTLAALWVLADWSDGLTGFEWLHLGNAASDMSLVMRLAPLTGVWGPTFVFALMSSVIAAVIRRQRFASAWLLLLLGLYTLPELPAPQRGTQSAIIVQPNIDDETVWSPELQARMQQELASQSLSPLLGHDSGSNRGVKLIVWPEMPAPFYENDPRFIAALSNVASASHAAVITGAIGRLPDHTPLNTALTMGPDGALAGRYDKVNLVPFGEFVPWPFGSLTSKISTEAGDFAAGSKVVVTNVGGHRIGTFICYEAVFPGYVRQFAAQGAEVLVNISNDSWFGHTHARYQHLSQIRMRAAENARWVVRATNDGVSGVIDPAGRLVRIAPEFQAATSRMQYGYRTELTLFTRFGNWFLWLCAAVVAAGFATNAKAEPELPAESPR